MLGKDVIADRSGGHDNHFNLLRMVAATGVLVSHSWPLTLGPDTTEPLQALLGYKLGTLCVFVFFAISGFYITRSYDRRRSWAPFLEARLLRLFPSLAVMLALTVVVAALWLTVAPAAVYWPSALRYFVNNVLLAWTQYEIAGVFVSHPYPEVINGSLWSLWYEFVCYMTVLAFGLAGVFARPARARWIVLGMVVLCLFLQIWHEIAPDRGWPYGDATYAFVGLPFAYGAALYLWRQQVPLSPVVLVALAGLAWLAQGTLAWLPLLQLALSYGVLLIGFAPAPRLLVYNRLGDYSYGMYIYAFPIQQLSAPLVAGGSPWVMVALALPLTLGCAVLSWHLVEAPGQRLRGRVTSLVARRRSPHLP